MNPFVVLLLMGIVFCAGVFFGDINAERGVGND